MSFTSHEPGHGLLDHSTHAPSGALAEWLSDVNGRAPRVKPAVSTDPRTVALVAEHEKTLLALYVQATGFIQYKNGKVPQVESATLRDLGNGKVVIEAQVRVFDLFKWEFVARVPATPVRLTVSTQT